MDKKSLSVFFRGGYGASYLDYPLFPDSPVSTYESFLLRAGGQDLLRSYMRDELITSMAAEFTDVAVQKYRPAILYLNGEYWGLYYIREKISEHYVAANYCVSPDSVTLTERNGSHCESYQELVRYAVSHDLSKQEHYDHISTLMDIPQYMDYIIAQIYIGNSDNSNVRFFTYKGGKWTWILYDTDLGMRSLRYNSVAEHLNPGGTAAGDYISTELLNALLENPDFEEAFLTRMAWQLNNVWTEANIHARIDAFVATIDADMPRTCARWGHMTYEQWQKYVQDLRSFASKRTPLLLNYIQNYFSLSDRKMQQYGFPT